MSAVTLWNGDTVAADEASLYVPRDPETGEHGEACFIYADPDRQEEVEAETPLAAVERRVREALSHDERDDELTHAAAAWLREGKSVG